MTRTLVSNSLCAAVFHVIAFTLFAYWAYDLFETQKANYVGSISAEIESISQTMADLSSDGPITELASSLIESESPDIKLYKKLSEQYQSILIANELKHFEMSYIMSHPTNGSLYRVVSSDPIYSFGEKVLATDLLLTHGAKSYRAALHAVNENITKIIVSKPVFDQSGETTGFIRIESSDITDNLKEASNYSVYIFCICLYLILASIIVPKMLKRTKFAKMGKVNEDMHEEIKQKNTDLKMLSLVAKKSENLMLITDKKGEILWVNETSKMKNNYRAEELNQFVGKYLPEVSRNDKIKTILKNVVDFKKSVVYESSGTDLNGRNYYAMTTVTPITDDEGGVCNLLFVDTDISRLKRAQKENEVFKEFILKSTQPWIHLNIGGDILFANSAASPLLDQWKDEQGDIRPEVLAMMLGIYDSSSTQSIEAESLGKNLLLNIHPDTNKGELYVIAQDITIEKKYNHMWLKNNLNDKKAG